MTTENSSKSGKLLAIVATMMTREFKSYFTGEQKDTVALFENGAQALDAWRLDKTPYFFCDHAGLADGMTSFRLIKQIRADEENKGATHVYVMSENPQAHERNLAASYFGATGIILRTPQAVNDLMGGVKARLQSGTPTASVPSQADEKVQLETLFRKFVGPVASQLLSAIHQDLGAKLNQVSFREYASLLAQKIRTDSMRNSFYDAVRALKK